MSGDICSASRQALRRCGPSATVALVLPKPPKVMSSPDEGELAPHDERVLSAWQAWLSALATDPEAALAAALTYEALDDEARSRWLDALDQDAPRVPVPKVAIYAPLLWVESDPERRDRIAMAVGSDTSASAWRQVEARTLRGVASNGDRVVALVLPLYLDFVQVLACRFKESDGFAWVKHDPLLHDAEAPMDGSHLDAIALERTPFHPVIEELAHAIVAHQRSGRPPPEALRTFAHLFDSRFEQDAS